MRIRQQFSRIGLPAIFAGLVFVTASTAFAVTTCFDFSAPPTNTTYVFGDVINTADATVRMAKFQWSNGTWYTGGAATVRATNYALGTPSKELQVNNINVVVEPDTPAYSASFRYEYMGGTTNFGANGTFVNLGDNPPSDLDGTTVGGVDIDVVWTSFVGGEVGAVYLTAPAGVDIQDFGIGGQEFHVDDICFSY